MCIISLNNNKSYYRFYRKSANNNQTQQNAWRTHINSIINTSLIFFNNNIINKVTYEGVRKYDLEQLTYKEQFAWSLIITVKVALFTEDFIMPRLRSSARGTAV